MASRRSRPVAFHGLARIRWTRSVRHRVFVVLGSGHRRAGRPRVGLGKGRREEGSVARWRELGGRGEGSGGPRGYGRRGAPAGRITQIFDLRQNQPYFEARAALSVASGRATQPRTGRLPVTAHGTAAIDLAENAAGVAATSGMASAQNPPFRPTGRRCRQQHDEQKGTGPTPDHRGMSSRRQLLSPRTG